jgi:hypothetical protein
MTRHPRKGAVERRKLPQGNRGNSSGSTTAKACVQPTTFQRIGISLQATAASFWNKTIGLGLGGSVGGGNIIGVSGSYSRQLVVSPNGQAAFVSTFSNASALPFACCSNGTYPESLPFAWADWTHSNERLPLQSLLIPGER